MGCIPFHIGLCLWKVPAAESLSHASGVPAPFDKGAFGCTADTGRVRVVTNCKKPPCALTAAARRNTSLPEGGGLGRSPKPEGASGRTAHLTARDGTSPVVLITPITYHPSSKPELHRPLAPSGTCGASSLPEGAMGCGAQKETCCKSLVLQQAHVFIPSSQCRGLCSGAGRPRR